MLLDYLFLQNGKLMMMMHCGRPCTVICYTLHIFLISCLLWIQKICIEYTCNAAEHEWYDSMLLQTYSLMFVGAQAV